MQEDAHSDDNLPRLPVIIRDPDRKFDLKRILRILANQEDGQHVQSELMYIIYIRKRYNIDIELYKNSLAQSNNDIFEAAKIV